MAKPIGPTCNLDCKYCYYLSKEGLLGTDTNWRMPGDLLDDEWCEFLTANNFLVGLSIDGPRELHDHYRKDKGGKGSFDRVLRGARLLKKHGTAFATLSCVNRLTARHPLEVYRFLRDEIGAQLMQFIPLVGPKVFRNTSPQYWSPAAMPIMGTPGRG